VVRKAEERRVRDIANLLFSVNTNPCHLGESLVRAIAEYAAHYHEERSHQGIGNELISGAAPQGEGSVEARERLGGLLKYYYKRAA
jgi:hypothetical protein